MKRRIGIIFGGKSAEHEVSLQSAANVIEALDKDLFEPVLIGIDKEGKWHLTDQGTFLINAANPGTIHLAASNQNVALAPNSGKELITDSGKSVASLDAVFPVLHGPMGEDGSIQGLLKLAGLPFIGPSILGSAVGMDKDVMKRLLRDSGVPIGNFVTLNNPAQAIFSDLHDQLGLPFFLKPANMGSSIGVSKVHNEKEFDKALEEAFEYDTKVICEEFIGGREIECSVLGNVDPIASLPGEIIAQHEFYSYDAKYIDEQGATVEVPANLNEKVIKKVQDLAIKTFSTLCCEGMGRVDFFLRGEDEVIVNEINTIPGFTKISMYPKLWEASGISYTELITRLIDLAILRFEREQKLKTSR